MIRNIEITETGIEEDRIVMLEKKVRDLGGRRGRGRREPGNLAEPPGPPGIHAGD